jgi:hypothetical protein
MAPNDEVERRVVTANEGTLSQSSDHSFPHRSCDQLLQPIVRGWQTNYAPQC